MTRILVVEDDRDIGDLVSRYLEKADYVVELLSSGREALRALAERPPDLLILDLMLPKMSGFEICRKLRAASFDAPILMLTARGDEGDRVLGLDLGADDYVTKPFSVRELLARVRALLRRQEKSDKLPDELRFDDVVVDFRRCEALKRGSALALTRKEFGVLRLLAAKAGAVVSRDDLLNGVWGYDSYPNTRTVDVHIALLRSKLEDNPSTPRRLITVYGMGYKLVIS